MAEVLDARDSPTCANYALQRTAMDNQAIFPDAASAVLVKLFMDDYLNSFDYLNVVFELSQELLALCDFMLTKFKSNLIKINYEIKPSKSTQQQESKTIVNCGDKSSHVFGLKWVQIDDTLVAIHGVNREPKSSITQRKVLNFVFSRPIP